MRAFKWLRNIFMRKPIHVKLHNWNSTRTEAHLSAKDFDRHFAGWEVIHDLDTGKTYGPYNIGTHTVMVIRDEK